MLDVRRLRYFLAVAGDRSFTRASERLHVAQSALSRQVRLLEEELGTPLLVRGGASGIETTPAGALLVAEAPALLDGLDVLAEQAVRLGAVRRGPRTLRLGYAASAGYDTATRVVAGVRRRDDQVAVQARVVCTADALDALRADTLDAAILRAPPAADDLSSRPLRRELQGVLVRADHALAQHEAIALTALRDVPLVIHPRDANPGRYDILLAACRAAGFEPRLEQPLVAFDPAHQKIAEGTHATFISDPGALVPPGMAWRPTAPAIVLDVCLITPLVPTAEATPTLVAAAREVSAELGWLDDPRGPTVPSTGHSQPRPASSRTSLTLSGQPRSGS